MHKKPERSKSKSCIRIIDPHYLDMSIIREAAKAVRLGGVVVFPTTNLYGLGADIYNNDAVRRLFQIKRRSPEKPVSILIKSRRELDFLVTEIPPIAYKLMDRFWPGKMTIVFKARPEVPLLLTADTGRIGIRVPGHPVAMSLVNMLDHPLTATSANISGMDGVHRIQDLSREFINDVSLVLDAGLLQGGKGSTVVDVTTDAPMVLREGEIAEKEVFGI